MAKSPSTRSKKSPRRSLSWESVDLNEAPTAFSSLSSDQKDDSVSQSRHLVRHRRFRSSYMMATNGGATFEDILRPPPALDMPVPTEPKPDKGDLGLQNVIGPSDDRTQINDTSRIPARSVGLLEIVPQFGPLRYGTAWLIGPRTLATAAHNLVHPQAGAAQSMRVGMACDGVTARGGWHKIIDNKFETGWQNNMVAGSEYDFAVLKIEDASVGQKLGWFGFADYHDAKFGDMPVNVIGYPFDLQRFYMYGSIGRVKKVDESRLYYDADAGEGMSGGPVIARFGEERIAVGVHVAGGSPSNVGTRLTSLAYNLFSEFRDW
ncbi:MAG: trypsin-like peptidase domain-containing protein [Pseudomonadota bacterium]